MLQNETVTLPGLLQKNDFTSFHHFDSATFDWCHNNP